MKEMITAFWAHKDLYIASLSIGTIFSSICAFFVDYTPMYIFGVSTSLFAIALIINIIDIHTGIKADTKRKSDLGQAWKFESRRGWRAFEKIFVFTIIIWFLWTLEKEALRLEAFSFLLTILQSIKFIMLIYVVLIELQSIGENEETRFGKKGKMFTLLDNIISIVNDGILNKLRSLLKTKE